MRDQQSGNEQNECDDDEFTDAEAERIVQRSKGLKELLQGPSLQLFYTLRLEMMVGKRWETPNGG